MQIIDVDEAPVPFDRVSGLEARCPLCRTQTTASLNRQRTNDLVHRYPKQYAQRVAEENSSTSSRHRDGDEIKSLTLYIGNRHQLLPDNEGRKPQQNQHDWTFFVRPSNPSIIEEVHIYLHPTFRPSHIIHTYQPYEVRRRGWGCFTISTQLVLKPGYSWVSEEAQDSADGAEKGVLGLEWRLDFEGSGGKGSMGRLRLKVRSQRGWEEGREREEDERARERRIRSYERDRLYVPREEE